MRLLAAFLIVSAALAGCLDTDPAPDTPSDPEPTPPAQRYDLPEDPMPEGPGHDHTDGSQHKFLWNYEFSARDPLLGNDANAAGVHALDVQAGYMFGAVYGSHTVAVDGGVVIWDLADPAHPEQVGRWVIPGSVGGDRSIGATQDGDYVVISTEPITCFSQVGSNPFSVYLIDARDKSMPVVSDVVTVSGQSVGQPDAPGLAISGHSVYVAHIDGRDWAFVSGTIYEIVRTEQGARLVATGDTLSIGHDMYIRDAPYNKTWAIAAGGTLRIYDVTDPEDPAQIAFWEVPDGQWFSEYDYYIHTADIAYFEDQDIFIVSTEDWLDWTSVVFIVDATPLRNQTAVDAARAADDPMLLQDIGLWKNPGNHTASGLSFSLHNPRFGEDGIMTISSYHGGLWQLDFRHPDFRTQPEEIAYAVYSDADGPLAMDPVQGADACSLGYTVDAPTYMDVELGPDGILYAADVYTGLYTFVPTPDHPVYGFTQDTVVTATVSTTVTQAP